MSNFKKIDTYQEVLEKFFRLEVIQEYSLATIQSACDHFGNPEKSYKIIHIAGTNGKGNVLITKKPIP